MKSAREILMVEDSVTDGELARRAFKLADFVHPLKLVSSGEAAWDYLLGTGEYAVGGPARPLLILLDLNLPGMSGLEFLRLCKSHEATRTIPVVVLSLSEGDRNIMTCVRLGSDGYIIKPLDIDNLVRVAAKLKLPLALPPPAKSA